jgi:ribosomal protein L35
MTKKRKRQLRGSTMVHETDVGRLERLLPGAK